MDLILIIINKNQKGEDNMTSKQRAYLKSLAMTIVHYKEGKKEKKKIVIPK